MEASNKSIVKATKWSVFTEILAKLAAPISSMILARILAPEAYGIIASVSMLLSFCELFADAGFNKYIVQHKVKDEDELNKIITIAFWTNLFLTLCLWGIVSVCAKPIAELVGCPGKELAVIVACANLPIHGLVSILSAKLRRDMDFKTLFIVRAILLLVPFLITIPVALATKSYWALIIGTIAGNLTNLLALCIRLKWKPILFYNIKILQEMFSFSMWSMLEAFFVWLINWGDVFIVAQLLAQDQLGIYRTSINMVSQITGIVSASVIPVLLSSLSKAQNDDQEFKDLFYSFSTVTGLFLIPMGVGMFIYRDLMCYVALGDAWTAGATLMGIWGLVNSITILFNSFNGHVLIAKGKPKISVILQIIQIAFILPAVYISAKTSFEFLSYTSALIRLSGTVLYCIVIWKMYKISCFKTLRTLIPTLVATAFMACAGIYFTSLGLSTGLALGSILACVLIYGVILFLFPSIRRNYVPILRKLIKK